MAQPDALFTTGPRDAANAKLEHPPESTHLALYLDANNAAGAILANQRARASKRSLAGGGAGSGGGKSFDEEIDFSSDVLILSGRVPILDIVLIIDDGGEIVTAIIWSSKVLGRIF